MKILNVNITNKVAVYSQRGGEIVCGNDDYQIKFTFDAEWDAYNSKTARFKWNGFYYDATFSGDTVSVPRILNASYLEVGVYAGETLHTSTSAVITCLPSCICGAPVEAPETQELFLSEVRKEEAQRQAAEAERVQKDADRERKIAEIEALVGDIDSALDGIIAIQEELIGIITFTYEDATGDVTDYAALKGMTWGEFVTSKYNTYGFVHVDNVIRDADGNDVRNEDKGAEIQYADTVIIDGTAYIHG